MEYALNQLSKFTKELAEHNLIVSCKNLELSKAIDQQLKNIRENGLDHFSIQDEKENIEELLNELELLIEQTPSLELLW